MKHILYKGIKQSILYLLVFSMLLYSFWSVSTVYAESGDTSITYGNYQYFYDGDGNEISTLQVYTDGSIYLYGRHHHSTSTINYRTYGYNFTLKDTNGKPRSVGSDNYFYVERSESDEGGNNPYTPDDDYVVDQYKLDGKEVVQGLIKIMRNAKNDDGTLKYKNIMDINAALAIDDEGKGGVTIYMSNAFQVIHRDSSDSDSYTAVGNLCHSLSGFLQEVVNLYGVEWSQATQNILPYYYDNPIKIGLSPFYFNVVYIDEEDYINGNISEESILATASENQETHCGSDSQFTLKDPSNILINGKSYEYAGESYYKYNNKDGYYSTISTDGEITVTHQFQRDATMYVLVKSKGDNDVYARYVDKQGNLIKDYFLVGRLTLNEYFTYNTESPFKKGSNIYTYTNEYSYIFHSKASDKEKTFKTSGSPVKFRLNDVKEDTKVYLTLVYDKDQEAVVSDYIKFFEPSPTGIIKADNKGSEKFDVEQGIPTTESLYGTVQGAEYLIDANFSKISGSKTLPIKVSKSYILEWEEEVPDTIGEDGEPEEHDPIPKSDTVKVEKTVYVKREYTYTEITDINYYKIKEATLSNYALPGSQISLTPNGYSVPTLNYNHYQSNELITKNEHLIQPSQVNSGITLESETISGGTKKPSVPSENFTSIADGMVDEIQVRNDYLEFDGNIVLDSGYKDTEAPVIDKSSVNAPTIIEDRILYKSNNTIEATKSNGTFSSSGTISYEQVIGFNSELEETITYDISNINSIIIHTPVYCEAAILNDNSQYVQLVQPNNSCVPIVLDEDGITSDFVIDISNTGYHTSKKGYKSRDYSINTKGNASYIAQKNGLLRNEVKFPFPVFLDKGNDKDISNDILIRKDTWYTVGENNYRFYVPAFVEEGIYQVDFRTIAVNGTGKLSATESTANTDLDNYVATDSISVQVSGRLYGLTIYDIYDYPLWQEVFRKSNSLALKLNENREDGTLLGLSYNKNYQYYYTTGTNNSYGKSSGRSIQFTFPLIMGSHAKYRNQGVLKAGYHWRFTLDTIGSITMEDGSYITMEPCFYYIDKNGQNREKVDLYYSETVDGEKRYLVKVGSSADMKNIKTEVTGSAFLSIPRTELINTAAIRGIKLSDWITQRNSMYFYGGLTSNNAFKTFSAEAYASTLLTSQSGTDIINIGVTKEDITKRKQSYYFTYSLPDTVKAVSKDFDIRKYAKEYGVNFKESFWKKDGYLIMNVQITAYDKKGNAYMSYLNEENSGKYNQCNMWSMEGGGNSKTDSTGTTFNFNDGDFIMIYTDKTRRDDYKVGGIY